MWVLLAVVGVCGVPAGTARRHTACCQRPGLAVSAPAAAAQYGGGPVVLEPATSLNTIATTMEHGSARPGFVGVHIGAGQHSEVSNDVNENLATILMLILSNPNSPTSFLPLSLLGRALHNPPWLRPLQWRRMEAFLNQTCC